MASKWKKILKGKKLPALPVDPSWKEQVDDARDEFWDLKLDKLIDEFDARRKRKENLEAKIKEINVEQEALGGLILDKMDNQNLESVTVHGGVFYQQVEPYAQVVDRSKIFQWIKQTRQISLLTVQWQTLNALVKDMLIKGNAAPPGVKVFLKTSIRRREAQ